MSFDFFTKGFQKNQTKEKTIMKHKILLYVNATISLFSGVSIPVVVFKARIGVMETGFATAFIIMALITAIYAGVVACYHEHFAK